MLLNGDRTPAQPCRCLVFLDLRCAGKAELCGTGSLGVPRRGGGGGRGAQPQRSLRLAEYRTEEGIDVDVQDDPGAAVEHAPKTEMCQWNCIEPTSNCLQCGQQLPCLPCELPVSLALVARSCIKLQLEPELSTAQSRARVARVGRDTARPPMPRHFSRCGANLRPRRCWCCILTIMLTR